MATEHTPTPWRVFPGDKSSVYSDAGDVFIVQVGDDLMCIDDEIVPEPDEAVSNAAFIVRACNAHYQMLEALKDIYLALEAKRQIWSREMSQDKRDRLLASNDEHLRRAEEGIAAAIAAAEAEGR